MHPTSVVNKKYFYSHAQALKGNVTIYSVLMYVHRNLKIVNSMHQEAEDMFMGRTRKIIGG